MIVIEPSPGMAALPPLSKRELQRFLALAIKAVPLRGAVSILVTGDDPIRDLNRRFRHKDEPTDVLSFPAANPEMQGLRQLAGDLAISAETAARQAHEYGHSLDTEVKILMLHGLLHLAGLDHETDAGEMAEREQQLREHFELPAGLIHRATANKPPKTGRTKKRPDTGSSITMSLPKSAPASVKPRAAKRQPARKRGRSL